MRLAGLEIKNFKLVGPSGCQIKIDEIVVLVGQNNAGKSTILDAYEAFASSGKELDISYFHNEDSINPIKITGIFSDIKAEDEAVIGQKWKHNNPEFGECIKVRWVWSAPGEKAKKQSFNPETKNFEDGGVGGWDSQIQSRIPQPIRIRPTDPIDITQTKIVGILKDFVKTKIKSDSSSTREAYAKIEELAQSLFEESKSEYEAIATKITENVGLVFPGTTIELVPKSKDAIDEKLIGAESFLKIGTTGGGQTPLMLQGTGIQRALLWSALSVMADTGGGKKKTKGTNDSRKILLIDEPEAFLHPPTVRSAREALYSFALNNPEWQVIATTHSPIFIDLSKDHTTIVRVDASSMEQKYVSTDKISFDAKERTRLQMVRACNPMVNEFFFFNRIVLVEGPTEQITTMHFADDLKLDVHVIDCLGKANIPLFARILNQFKVPYTVIHDSDTPKATRKGKQIKNPMWSVNASIREVVSESNGAKIFTQFPNFEGEFLGESLSSGKVDRVIELLSDQTSPEHILVADIYRRILSGDEKILTTTEEEFEKKRSKYVSENSLEQSTRWFQ